MTASPSFVEARYLPHIDSATWPSARTKSAAIAYENCSLAQPCLFQNKLAFSLPRSRTWEVPRSRTFPAGTVRDDSTAPNERASAETYE